MTKQKISTVIITKNNEQIIRKCIESIAWTDEIIIVDSGSTDNTLKICKEYNCKIIETQWTGFGKTKRIAVDNAVNDWIFSIDTDEVCSDDLRKRIQKIIKNPNSKEGYKIKRRTYFLGKLIKFSGWQNDYPLRLFQKKYGNFNEREIHEYVVVNGEVNKIKELILHDSYPSIATFIAKMDTYTTLSAQEAFLKNKKSNLLIAVCKGAFKFIKMFLLQLGFLDGIKGYILAKNSAFGVFIKYIKIYELYKISMISTKTK